MENLGYGQIVEPFMDTDATMKVSWDKLSGFDDYWSKLSRANTFKFEDENAFFTTITALTHIAFAFGFTLGGMFELTDSEAVKEIEAIKTFIKSNELVPFIPRKEIHHG